MSQTQKRTFWEKGSRSIPNPLLAPPPLPKKKNKFPNFPDKLPFFYDFSIEIETG